MLAWIVSLITAVFHFIPTTIWVIILIAGTIIFLLGGEGWLGFVKIALSLLAFYCFLWILAALLPTWLENVAILVTIGVFWWLRRN
ncbi:MAG: hypothetical protein IJX99_00985 [Clostridia bacterium]|nr:hypothetical protein [Clostridia bacterium]